MSKQPLLRFKDKSGERFNDWTLGKLGDLGEIITGKTPPTRDKSLWNGDIMFVTPSDIDDSIKYIRHTGRHVVAHKNLKLLPPKSILYTCIASVGKMCMAAEPCISNQQINALIVNSPNNPDFIYYALAKLTPKIKATQANTTLPIINKTEFSKFWLPTPPPKEQRKIADFLGKVDNRIDGLRLKKALLEDYKKGLQQQIFSQKIRFKDKNNSSFKDWESLSLEQLCTLSAGHSKSKHILEKGSRYIIDMGAISDSGRLILNKQTDYKKDLLHIGDLVMPKDDIGGGNIIGKVAHIDKNHLYVLGDHVYLLSQIKCISLYLYYAINSYGVNKSFRRKANGTAQLGLPRKAVLEQKIPVPQDREEQQKIADFLGSADAKISLVTSQLEAAMAFKKGLLQKMFI